MHRIGFADETHYPLATGAGTTRATDNATLRFSPGTTLRFIKISPSPLGAFGGPAGSIDVAIEFISAGRVLVLKAGFASGATSPTGGDDVVWEGELLIDSKDSLVYAAARNDTGSTVEVFLTVYGDKEVPEVEE